MSKKQLIVVIEPQTFRQFKTFCTINDTSMTQQIRKFVHEKVALMPLPMKEAIEKK